jgi:hypothetical protein
MNLEGLTFSQKMDLLDEYRAANPLRPLPYELQEFRDSIYRHRDIMELRKRERALPLFLDIRRDILQAAGEYREAVAYMRGQILMLESSQRMHRLVHEMLEDIRGGVVKGTKKTHRLAEEVLTDSLDNIKTAKAARAGAIGKIDTAQKILDRLEKTYLQKVGKHTTEYGNELEDLRIAIYSVTKAVLDGAKALRYTPPAIMEPLEGVLSLVKASIIVELPPIPGDRRKIRRRLTAPRLTVEPEIYDSWLHAVKAVKGGSR